MKWSKQIFRNVTLYCTEIDIGHLEGIFEEAKIPDARKVFVTDFNGFILRFTPPAQGMTWGNAFYIQNLMIMQRLEQVDRLVRKLQTKEREAK